MYKNGQQKYYEYINKHDYNIQCIFKTLASKASV